MALYPEADAPTDVLRAEAQRWTALTLGLARSALFRLESLPLRGARRLGGQRATDSPPPAMQEAAAEALFDLLVRDADRIARGVYPLSVLAPERPAPHALRLARVLIDSVGVARRAVGGDVRHFGRRAKTLLDDLPDYYRRNFHHQTDGYLSETSAELYEHQVQLLFHGAADAMRRLIVEPLKDHLGSRSGKGLRLLELGAGCGSATRAVAAALPHADITCLDLSEPYVARAKRRFKDQARIHVVRGDASHLDFDDDSFDAVYSVFLHHELPAEVRTRVVREAFRVVRKTGGCVAAVDALQVHDNPDFRWALERFPERFHEPYFRDYVRSPLELAMRQAGGQRIEVERGFLAKLVAARA